MEIHALLARQLNRFSLTESDFPKDKETWSAFLARVSQSYRDSDQERRLGERSQEISSQELKALFERLQESQKIAHLGSWLVTQEKKQVECSAETFKIFGRSLKAGFPSYDDVLAAIHPDYREKFENAINMGFENGTEVAMDVKIVVHDEPQWVHAIVSPKYDPILKKYTKITGTAVNIDKQKKDEENLHELNKQLILAARRAGMAEVATSVLHNIGNVMNSVNVSANTLIDKLAETKLSGLSEIGKLLEEHQHDFENFVTENAQGKNLFSYLKKLPNFWETRKEIFLNELNLINQNIKHMKDIISMQQTLSGSLGAVEEVSLTSITEDALKLNISIFASKNVTISFEPETKASIFIDRVKLLQVLVNLIRNAYDSVLESQKKDKSIKIIVKDQDQAHVSIVVIDNGLGIKKENFEKIFTHGFTTKKGGHGFGLHASALSVREMGGALTMKSEGEGLGCEFTLLFPKKNEQSYGEE